MSETLLNSPEARNLADLQAHMLRPAQNANRDGGFELGWGVALLFFSLVPYLNTVLPKSLWMSAWTSWIGFLPLYCAAFAPFAIPKLIQPLITWPRAGYVANPNDLKLSYLIQIMIFGSALGCTISLPLVLVPEIRQALGQSGPHSGVQQIVLKSIKLLICAVVTVYLAPKVIKKSKPAPAAYDAQLIAAGLKQTPSRRRRLGLVKLTLLAMFIGLPLVLAGVVFGLMSWSKSVGQNLGPDGGVLSAETDWSQLATPSFLVATNALLYLMGSGVVLKPNRWKWFVLPLMLVAPILVAPAIPHPPTNTLTEIFALLPPVMLCVASVWLFSGTLTLMLFIRRNPVPSARTA
jgi:hypothetical protein